MSNKFDTRLFMAAVRREAVKRNASLNITWQELSDLLKLSGKAFLEASYQRILGRDLDPQGLAGYEERAKHLTGRLRILLALMLSPEQSAVPPRLGHFLMYIRRLLHRDG